MSIPLVHRRIFATHESAWVGWSPPSTTEASKYPFRSLAPSSRGILTLPRASSASYIAVFYCIGQALKPSLAQWALYQGDKQLGMHIRKSVPQCFFLHVLPQRDLNSPLELRFEPRSANAQGPLLTVDEVVLLPFHGQFSERWTSIHRAAISLISKQPLSWAPADFPYSHFDGLHYIFTNARARSAVFSRRYKTAFAYFYAKGRKLGDRLPLAVDRPPNPGSVWNLAKHFFEMEAQYTRFCEQLNNVPC
jgi:hypothetical protein